MKHIKSFALAALLILLSSTIAMGASYATTSVSGTAVQIYTPTSAATTIGVIIQNDLASTVTVYVGSDSSVTSSTHGYCLAPGQGVILNGHLNAWWVITAGTAASVNYQLLY